MILRESWLRFSLSYYQAWQECGLKLFQANAVLPGPNLFQSSFLATVERLMLCCSPQSHAAQLVPPWPCTTSSSPSSTHQSSLPSQTPLWSSRWTLPAKRRPYLSLSRKFQPLQQSPLAPVMRSSCGGTAGQILTAQCCSPVLHLLRPTILTKIKSPGEIIGCRQSTTPSRAQ